jgi:hypothetical protein
MYWVQIHIGILQERNHQFVLEIVDKSKTCFVNNRNTESFFKRFRLYSNYSHVCGGFDLQPKALVPLQPEYAKALVGETQFPTREVFGILQESMCWGSFQEF